MARHAFCDRTFTNNDMIHLDAKAVPQPQIVCLDRYCCHTIKEEFIKKFPYWDISIFASSFRAYEENISKKYIKKVLGNSCRF